ncbi:hypothetical protein [Enterococcus sp. DIV0756]|uniref:hypothetical protein n=1 Tax=Enterococcus sp. DIV0756 TaxID=2774636 RepID=UPI003F262FB3
MELVKLDFIQIFGRMTKENLMKRVRQYFEQTQNASKVVEALVAILLRNALCRNDYSVDLLTDLIRQIFLTTEPNDTLRKHCVYFEKFFSGKKADGKKEWMTVIDRLFMNETEYREFTKETRRYKELLEKMTSEEPEISEFTFDIVSTFTDASGKKSKWTLRDTKGISEDSPNKADEVAELLPIMTTLTIFQNAKGIRRFTEFLEYESPLRRSGVKRKAKKTQQNQKEESAQTSLTPPPTNSTHLTLDSTIDSSTPKKNVNPVPVVSGAGTNKLSYEKYMDKEEAKYQLTQAALQTEPKGCSAAPNPVVPEQPPTSKVANKPQNKASSSPNKGKSKGQIQLETKKKKKKKKSGKNKKGKKWK